MGINPRAIPVKCCSVLTEISILAESQSQCHRAKSHRGEIIPYDNDNCFGTTDDACWEPNHF